MSKQNFSDCPDFLREFLFYMLTIKGRSPRTVEAYHIDLRGFLRYIKSSKDNTPFENLQDINIENMSHEYLKKITLNDTYNYLNFMMSSQKNSATARSRKVSAIRSLFKYLTTKSHLLQDNPVKELEVPALKKTVPKHLSLEESLELLAVANDGMNQRDYCILVLFLNCGMRLSELVGIDLHNIKDNTLTLLGKGNKERVIFLNNSCLLAIKSYLEARQEIKPKPESKQALFLSKNGNRISPRRVEQIVKDYLKKANLGDQGYSPHKLRHTAATLMYQHGNVDVRILKEILGHVSLSTTEIYTHVANKQMENAADCSPLSSVKAKKKTKLEA